MMPYDIKRAFYLFAGPLMFVNGLLFRRFLSSGAKGARVHLGPGQRNYLKGWINVDANAFSAKCDLWFDLRRKLPFQDASVSCFYSHHVVEHLPDLEFHFKDVFRCLAPGGRYRVAGPNAHSAILKYLEGDTGWFSSFPREWKGIGGRLNNFVLCANEHLAILTPSYMEELLLSAGFSSVTVELAAASTASKDLFSDCLALEHESDPAFPHTLVVEAVK